jgi:hypothetical protein
VSGCSILKDPLFLCSRHESENFWSFFIVWTYVFFLFKQQWIETNFDQNYRECEETVTTKSTEDESILVEI